jgi:hypothetical protein
MPWRPQNRSGRAAEHRRHRRQGDIAAKGFDDATDGVLRAAIRDQVGSVVKRLHRNGEVEKIGRAGAGCDGS